MSWRLSYDPGVEFGNERDGELAGFPERFDDEARPVAAGGRGREYLDRDILGRLGSDSRPHAGMVADARALQAQ